GAYAGIAVIGVAHSFWVALIAAPILVGLVAAVTEMITLRPIYRREPLYGLILTFGLALVFREGARQIWGGDMRRVLPPFTGSTPLLGRRIRTTGSSCSRPRRSSCSLSGCFSRAR